MGFMDKIKDVAGKNPDKVDKVTEKATDAFHDGTDGQCAVHPATGREMPGELRQGEGGGGRDQPPGGERPPGSAAGRPAAVRPSAAPAPRHFPDGPIVC